MKQWLLPAGSTSAEDLELQDVEIPVPGPGQVLVRVGAVSINGRDQMILSGAMGRDGSAIVPLSDLAGEIVAVGPAVSGWLLGDRVMTAHVPAWADGPAVPFGPGPGSAGDPGVAAQFTLEAADRLLRIPSGWSDDEAATLQVAGVTAWNALFGNVPLLPAQRVLVLGSGVVSVFAAQLAIAAGAEVYVAEYSRPGALAAAGIAVAGSVSLRDPGWGQRIQTQSGGVHKVVDTVGPGVLTECLAALTDGGEVAVLGLLDVSSPPLDAWTLIGKQASVRGVGVGSVAMHRAVADFMVTHDVRPIIARRVPFADLPEAYRATSAAGKTVVDVR